MREPRQTVPAINCISFCTFSKQNWVCSFVVFDSHFWFQENYLLNIWMWGFQDWKPMKISNIWYKNSKVLGRLKWVFTLLLLPEVYSQNWITPLRRETQEKEQGEKKRGGEGERRMHLALSCVACNVEIHSFSATVKSKHQNYQLRRSRGWRRSRSYCSVCCHGNS